MKLKFNAKLNGQKLINERNAARRQCLTVFCLLAWTGWPHKCHLCFYCPTLC